MKLALFSCESDRQLTAFNLHKGRLIQQNKISPFSIRTNILKKGGTLVLKPQNYLGRISTFKQLVTVVEPPFQATPTLHSNDEDKKERQLLYMQSRAHFYQALSSLLYYAFVC